MLIVIFGESCTGKSSFADWLRERLDAECMTGKDYLRMAKNESDAKHLFQQKLREAVRGANLIYVVTVKEHMKMIPEGAVRILAEADLDTIKQRFAQRMQGNLPGPVAKMLENNHGCYSNEKADFHYIAGETKLEDILEFITKRM